MRRWVLERCTERVDLLSRSRLPADTLRAEAIELLRRSIGFEMWGVPLVDPDTLIPYRPLVSDPPPWGARLPERWILDQGSRDINDRRTLAGGRDHVGVLSASTGGDLARCRRWRELGRAAGMGDELRAAIVDRYGCWGSFELFRASDDAPFDGDDAELVGRTSALLATAMRQAAVESTETLDVAPSEAGVVVIGDDLRPRGITESARAWFRPLSAATRAEPTPFPIAVYGTVGRLLAAEAGDDAERPARVRVRSATGRWAVVEAARLEGEHAIAVSIRPAHPDEVIDLLSRAHGLSARERQLVELVAAGMDTREVAMRLCISSHTAKDHLKSVFGKMGLHSRRELLALFVSCKAPTASTGALR